jgi:hypothetical protein
MNKIVYVKNTIEENAIFINPILPEDGNLSVKISLENADQIELILSDMNGLVVFKNQVSCVNGLNDINLDLGSYSNGLYFLKTITSSQIFTSKILK